MTDQVRMWNDFPYTVFDTGTLHGFKGAVNHWNCFHELCFLQFSVAQVLVVLRKQIVNNFVFSTWASTAGFNNNYNIDIKLIICDFNLMQSVFFKMNNKSSRVLQ